MANAPELSLRGGQRPTWRPEREARRSALGVQSREGSSVFAGVSLLSDRILRDSHVASLLGMTNLRASRHRMRIADIANERRYRRNRLVRFYRWPVRTASASPRFPRRFAPRNDKLESFTPQNAYRRYCQPAWRSRTAMQADFLPLPLWNRQLCAAPLQCAIGSLLRTPLRGRTATRRGCRTARRGHGGSR